jgi:hypothetical protein
MLMDEHATGQCDVCKVRHFERNHYFHGKMLSVRDLADEQKYFNQKRWLINRMVLGWGIVCGLDVALENGCLVVGPGLALDCCGHELLVCEPRRLKAARFIEVLSSKQRGSTGHGGPSKPASYAKPGAYGGSTSYGKGPGSGTPPEQGTPRDYGTPRDPRQPTEYGKPEGAGEPPEYGRPPEYGQPPDTGYGDAAADTPVRWVLCLEYQECRTEPCQTSTSCGHQERDREYNRIRDDYRLTVRPWKKACPDDHTEDCCPYDGLGRKTPLHQALVERSRTCPACKDCECVVVATGTLDETCQPPEIRLDDDHWKYRRIVYTNPALAGLIRCFHDGLPHIKAINWRPGSQCKVDEFLDLLSKHYLRVTFDQPMKANTVMNPRSCRLSVFYASEGSCSLQLFIPVQRIEYDASTTTATYHFDSDCLEQELRKVCKKLKKAADVELILHGSMIHNEHGRALDAELIDEFPTGNGVEGGEFIAYFTVTP